MELRGEQPAAGDRRAERAAVVGDGRHQRVVGGPGMIGMHEVERVAVRAPAHARAAPRDRVPAHVRHLEWRREVEPPNLPGEHAEPGMPPALPARLEEQLQAHADAEEWPVGLDVGDQRRHEAPRVQRRDRVGERAHAGQDDPLSGPDHVGVAGDRRLGAEPLEGLLHAAQVAAAVIDDGDPSHGGSLRLRTGRGEGWCGGTLQRCAADRSG